MGQFRLSESALRGVSGVQGNNPVDVVGAYQRGVQGSQKIRANEEKIARSQQRGQINEQLLDINSYKLKSAENEFIAQEEQSQIDPQILKVMRETKGLPPAERQKAILDAEISLARTAEQAREAQERFDAAMSNIAQTEMSQQKFDLEQEKHDLNVRKQDLAEEGGGTSEAPTAFMKNFAEYEKAIAEGDTEKAKLFKDKLTGREVGKSREKMTADQFRKTAALVRNQERSINSLQRYFSTVEGAKQGIGLTVDKIIGNLTTVFGGQIENQEQFNALVSSGDLQKQLGRIRLEVLGGGVLTEKDAERLVAAMGGDVNAFRNKQVVARAIRDILREKVTEYNEDLVPQFNQQLKFDRGDLKEKKKIEIDFDSLDEAVAGNGDVVTIKGVDDYNKLKSGDTYIDPTGKKRVKK